jgi:transglutaminase-like putative cysteine protease
MTRTNLIDIEHCTAYTYSTPVEVAHHVAYLRPLDNAQQQVESFDMDVQPLPTHQGIGRDLYGNTRAFFSATQVHDSLTVRAVSRVLVRAREAALAHADTPAWESVRDRLRYAAGAPFEPAVEFAQPSLYVPRVPGLCELAQAHFASGTPVALGAVELMHAIHRGFKYESASTAIDTPLANVLSQRRGVCQDFAHVMIGALRMLGLAARYVSGYLLTEGPPGHQADPGAGPPQAGETEGHGLVGADASHAWVAVWCPGLYGTGDADGDWLELDPTNDLLPSTGHVRLAVGRDYGDVAPLRGVIRGGGKHTLEVSVQTRRVRKLRESFGRGDEA